MSFASPSAPPPSARGSRIEILDALRGLAALAVVGYHYTTRYGELFGASPLPFGLPFGAYGVNLFFMISGFVIYMTLEATTRVGDFLVSRFSRLYPAFWTALSLTALVLLFADLPGRGVGLGQFLVNLTMLQEFVHVPAVDGVYWTLTVELRFYFWMLLLWLLGALRRPQWFVLPWLALALLRQYLPASVATALMLEYFPLFGFGIAVHALRRSAWRGRWAWAMALAALASAGPLNMLLMLLFGALLRWPPRWLNTAPLIWLGALSYPLYLVHQNIGYVIIRACGGGALGVLAALAGALLLAWCINTRVERPLIRAIRDTYRRRFPAPSVIKATNPM
jgi:peptidoglycan/LPS O-acetylase OafA/YrhL